MKYLLLIMLLLVSPLWAEEEVVFEDFSSLTKHLQTSMSGSEDYRLTARAVGLVTRISEVTRIRLGERLYMVDMMWVADVGEAVAGEQAPGRRKLLFVNLVDTLNGFQEELRSGYSENAVSRQEMKDALDRVIDRTSEIRVSGDVLADSGLEWCGSEGLVAEQPGEAISIVSGVSAGASASGGKVPAVRVSGSSSEYSGSSSAVGARTTTSSSSAGNKVVETNTNNSRTSHRVSHHSSVAPVVSQSQRTPPVSVQSAAVNQPVVSRPPTPSLPRPTPPPPPPPKRPQPLRPPPPPKIKTPGGVASIIFWLMTCLAAVGFMVIIFLIIKNMRKKIVQEQSQIMQEEKSLPPERMRSETIYEKALREAEQGNYAEAIRLLTIGSLILLDAHRVISYQDSLTNGEYLRELMVERDLYTLFSAPMALFDRLIYGFQSPGKKDFETFKTFYLDLEKLKR